MINFTVCNGEARDSRAIPRFYSDKLLGKRKRVHDFRHITRFVYFLENPGAYFRDDLGFKTWIEYRRSGHFAKNHFPEFVDDEFTGDLSF